MRSYSQNKEDLFISKYFAGQTGTLLSIGENDGRTFSNAKLLIEQGWEAHLVEPGAVFRDMQKLHINNTKVGCHNFGIGPKTERVKFYESGAHVKGGRDTGLVSTANPAETERWRKGGVQFEETEIQLYDFNTFYSKINGPTLDFISIDVEGLDWKVLQQIDLDAVGCDCLCIEWNGNPMLRALYEKHCAGFKVAFISPENLIFVR